ncbi:MAG: glycosyltransferase family 39 protein [Bacteroidota bacterium]
MIESAIQNSVLLFCGLIAVVLLFLGIGDMPLYILDEAKNAECAREMWMRQDWIVPTFNEVLRMDKPPLHYFAMMLAYSIFEVSAFSARFFSAVMGLLTLFAVYYYSKQIFGKSVAVWAVFVLLASLHFLFQFHLAVPDPYLITCITIAVFAFHSGLERENNWQLLLAYTTTALGTLAKGPIALGLVGLIMLLYLIFSRQLNWRRLVKLQIPLGAIWFCGLTLPWYIAVGKATNGEWLKGFFFTHNFSRFTDAMESHGGGFWMTFLYVFMGMLPFILFLPQALNKLYKAHYHDFGKRGEGKNSSTRFLLLVSIAAAVIIGFFAISTTKLPNYTVPAYPFLAVLLAYYLSDIQRTHLVSLLFHFFLATALVAGIYFGIATYELLADFEYLAFLFLPMLIGATISLVFHFKQLAKQSIRSILFGNIITAVLLFSIALPKVFQQNPVLQSLHLIEKEQNIITYRLFNPAYLFNLERTLKNTRSRPALKKYLQDNPKAPLLTQERYLKDMKYLSFEFDTLFLQQDLFEKQKTVILKRRQ